MNRSASEVAAGEAANLAYYEANAGAYARQTHHVDLSHLYEPFIALLPRHARILDVGCGGGRDLKAFRERGFKPLGLDPSPTLVQIAGKYSGAEVVVGKVETLECEEMFDGVWACASLHHLPRTELPESLRRIHQSLIAGGIFFLSVQAGQGEGFGEDGRFYTRYTQSEIRFAIIASGFHVLEIWEAPDAMPGRTDICWINLIARKPLPT